MPIEKEEKIKRSPDNETSAKLEIIKIERGKLTSCNPNLRLSSLILNRSFEGIMQQVPGKRYQSPIACQRC